jgi:hypothetical protein
MKKILYTLLLFGTIVQAQLTGATIGIISSQDSGIPPEPTTSYSVANHTVSNEVYDPSAQVGTALETIEVANGKIWVGASSQQWEYSFTEGEISSMSYDSKTGFMTQTRNLFHWEPIDGYDAYTGNFGENVYGYTDYGLPFDITTSKTYHGVIYYLGAQGSDMRGYAFNTDGTKIFALDVGTATIYEYDLVPAYIGTTSVTYTGNSLDISSSHGGGAGLDISPDENFLIYCNRTGDYLSSWELTTTGTLSGGATLDGEVDIDSETSNPYHVKYSEDGHYLYVADLGTDKIFQVNLNNDIDKYVSRSDDDAAEPINEVNGTSGWSTSSSSVSSVTTDPQDGSYAIHIVATSAVSYARGEFSFTAVIGDTYNIVIWAKKGATGSGQWFQNWTGFTGDSSVKDIDSTDWTRYTWNMTATSTSPVLKVYVTKSGEETNGADVYIDNIQIYKQL